MRNILCVTIVLAFAVIGCKATANTSEEPTSQNSTAVNNAVSASPAVISEPATASVTLDKPKTIREFFMALPLKYFPLESCEAAKDKGCIKAKGQYLKDFLEVEDTANGYLKSGCDGAQSCMEMAVFKKADGSYIVGLRSDFEMGSESYFLDPGNGKWSDVGSSIVEGWSKDNYYVLPRKGTTVEVFEKLPEDSDSDADTGKGKKLYDLEWKDGKFIKK